MIPFTEMTNEELLEAGEELRLRGEALEAVEFTRWWHYYRWFIWRHRSLALVDECSAWISERGYRRSRGRL